MKRSLFSLSLFSLSLFYVLCSLSLWGCVSVCCRLVCVCPLCLLLKAPLSTEAPSVTIEDIAQYVGARDCLSYALLCRQNPLNGGRREGGGRALGLALSSDYRIVRYTVP